MKRSVHIVQGLLGVLAVGATQIPDGLPPWANHTLAITGGLALLLTRLDAIIRQGSTLFPKDENKTPIDNPAKK